MLLLVLVAGLISVTNHPAYAAVDDSYTKSLLHFDGTNGSTTFTDESGKTWTASGSAKIDNSQAEFGGASGNFDGVVSYLSTGSSSDFSFAGDFTIDTWVKYSAREDNGTNGTGVNDSYYNGIVTDAKYNGGTINGWRIRKSYVNNTDQEAEFSAWTNGTSNVDLLGTSDIADGVWHHIAVVRHGSRIDLYVDGTSQANTTYSGTVANDSSGLQIGKGWTDLNQDYHIGWIDELRISNGTARWTSNFTPPTSEYEPAGLRLSNVTYNRSTAVIGFDYSGYDLSSVPDATTTYLKDNTIGNNTVAQSAFYYGACTASHCSLGSQYYYGNTYQDTDSFYFRIWQVTDSSNFSLSSVDDENTKSLLHFNGTNGSTTFTDQSGKAWTASGNAKIDTSQSKFGSASGNFDGVVSYLKTEQSRDFSFAGDFTIDTWVKYSGRVDNGTNGTGVSPSYYNGIVTDAKYNGGTINGWRIRKYYVNNTDQEAEFSAWTNGSSNVDLIGTSDIADGGWHHIAAVRHGSRIDLYVDGTSQANTTYSGTIASDSNGLQIGKGWTDLNQDYHIGWIDELRIANGIAKWTSNFTPPTSEYVNL